MEVSGQSNTFNQGLMNRQESIYLGWFIAEYSTKQENKKE